MEKTKKHKQINGINKDDAAKQVENCKYVYGLVNGWIENADNKVSVSCGLFTGAFGVITFLSNMNSSTAVSAHAIWKNVYILTLFISVVFFLLSVFFYVKAINPNLGKSGEKNVRKKYPIYYGDIQEYALNKYKELMDEAKDQDIINELRDEAHYNSKICYFKMNNYKKGLWLSFTSICIASVSWIAHFLMTR